jgi:hypothetical protein
LTSQAAAGIKRKTLEVPMRRALFLPLALLAAFLVLSLAACGGSKEYKADEHAHNQWQVEWDNCVWDVTHKLQDDGSYVEVQVPEDKLNALADQCMQKKGYHLKTADEAKKEKKGWLWW